MLQPCALGVVAGTAAVLGEELNAADNSCQFEHGCSSAV